MGSITKLLRQVLDVTLPALVTFLLPVIFLLPAWGAGTCDDFVKDGGFEDEINFQWWDQTSSNTYYPICNLEMCGLDSARTGDLWAWFGGTGELIHEVSAIEQSILLPPGGIIPLQFYLRTEESGATGDSDVIRVTLDGKILFSATASNPAYLVPGYVPVTLNLSAYANGNTHTLRFESDIFSTTSFFVDDISRPDRKFVNTSKIVNFADDLLQPLIDKALAAQEIRGQVHDSGEDIVVDLDNPAAVLTLKGGFGCGFTESAPGAMTTFRSLEIRSGKVVARNLVLKGNL